VATGYGKNAKTVVFLLISAQKKAKVPVRIRPGSIGSSQPGEEPVPISLDWLICGDLRGLVRTIAARRA
jgi:hypothetical protein